MKLKKNWRVGRLGKLLDIHSPSGHLLGTCWCRKRFPEKQIPPEELKEMLALMYERNQLLYGSEESMQFELDMSTIGYKPGEPEPEEDREWCSIYGYDAPREHVCRVGVCFNPHRDDQELQGTLQERFAKAKETIIEMRSW